MFLSRVAEYYIFYAIKSSDGEYVVRGRFLSPSGDVLREGVDEVLRSSGDVERRTSRLSKEKCRHGWCVCKDVPEAVSACFPPSVDLWVSNQEMLDLAAEMTKERYAVIEDVTGMGNRFDEGIEYLAQDTDDASMLRVLDKFGEWVLCLRNRFSSVILTEDAETALRLIQK